MAAGIVGIKPTVGLTSRSGVIPISETQDSVGPMGRCVADAVCGLDAIVGVDNEDPFTLVKERRQEKCYARFLAGKEVLRGARFGVPGKRFWDSAPESQRKVVEEVFDLIKEAGAEIMRVEMPCAEERIGENGEWDWERYGDTDPSRSEITVNKVECYYTFNRYLASLTNTPIKSLEDVIAFNDANRGTEGPYPGDHPAFPTGQVRRRL